MNTDQAISLIETIDSAYPQVNFDRKKMRTWVDYLIKGDYKESKKMLDKHVLENRYPPAISEILIIKNVNPYDAYMKKQNEKQEQLEREMNDPELAEKRKQSLDKLESFRKQLLDKKGESL